MSFEIVLFLIFYIPLVSIALDFVNFGPFTLYYALKWRFIRWKTKEKEHDFGEWIMVDCGFSQIRFCKNCGKMETR